MKVQRLEWFIAISAALHLILMSLASVTFKNHLSEPSGTYMVTLVTEPETAVMPAKAEGEAPVIPSKDAPSKETLMPDKTPPETNVTKTDETDRVRERIEALREKRTVAEALERIRQRAMVREIPVSSSEESTEGKTAQPQKNDEYSAYGKRLGIVIKSHWHFPGAAKKGREAIVSITVMRSGTIRINRIEKSSGDMPFDESALKAIKKASPFEPPPDECDFTLRFSDEELN